MSNNIPPTKPYITYEQWSAMLIKITAENTGQKEEDIILGSGAPLWYHDGFTPYQTFRETYQMENDGV